MKPAVKTSDQKSLDASAADRELAAQHELLALLDESLLSQVLATSTVVPYRKRRWVVKSGGPSSHVALLLAGAVRAFERDQSDNEVLVQLCRAPALLCEMEVLSDTPIRFNVQTLEDSKVLFVPADVFRQLIERVPEIARALTLGLAERLSVSGERLRHLAFSQLECRLASLLIDYATLSGLPTDQGTRIEIAITQHSIARDLAASRKAVQALLMRFKRGGLLDKIDGRYIITDWEQLAARGGRDQIPAPRLTSPETPPGD